MKYLWQRMLHKLARRLGLYGTLDSEQTIRTLKVENLHLKKELEAKRGFTVVHIDEARRPPAYEPPSPTTDGKIAAERLGIRARATYHELQRQTGKLSHHHDAMLGQKERAWRDTEPTTMIPKMPHKFNLVKQSEPLPDETLLMPVSWML